MFEAITNFIRSIQMAWAEAEDSITRYEADRAWNEYLRNFR